MTLVKITAKVARVWRNGFFCKTWGRKAEQLVEEPYEMRKWANLRILVFLFLQQSFCLGFFLAWLSLLPTAAVLESALCLRPIYLMKFSWLDPKLLELVLQSTCMVRVGDTSLSFYFTRSKQYFSSGPRIILMHASPCCSKPEVVHPQLWWLNRAGAKFCGGESDHL